MIAENFPNIKKYPMYRRGVEPQIDMTRKEPLYAVLC
jgi:hypothetical protein